MKKVFAIGFLASVVLVSGRFLHELAVSAQEAGAGPIQVETGDLDGDGSINVTDAVYLLRWLFRGGPAPEPVACPSLDEASLPATGQTTCSDAEGNEIDCTDGEFPGQDGLYRSGCSGSPGARLGENGDGTVSDHCTGLMWKKAPLEVVSKVWREALGTCEDVILAADGTWISDINEAPAHGGIKYDDWRLPSIRELESIVDYGRSDPAVDPVFEALPAGYWTSTSYDVSPDQAWCINLFNGKAEPIPKSASLKIALVRNMN